MPVDKSPSGLTLLDTTSCNISDLMKVNVIPLLVCPGICNSIRHIAQSSPSRCESIIKIDIRPSTVISSQAMGDVIVPTPKPIFLACWLYISTMKVTAVLLNATIQGLLIDVHCHFWHLQWKIYHLTICSNTFQLGRMLNLLISPNLAPLSASAK